MNKVSIFLFLTLAVPSLSAPAWANEKRSTPIPCLIKGVDYEGVVLRSRAWADQSKNTSWQPGPKDIFRAEKSLKAALPELRKKHFEGMSAIPGFQMPSLPAPLRAYKRQYFGSVENGHKVIFINLLCDAPSYWKENEVLVMDGGPCYIQVKYDVTSKKCIYYMENGFA